MNSISRLLNILFILILVVVESAAQTPTINKADYEGVIRVACVGNSITYGSGIEGREQNSYPAQLQALLGSRYDVRNFGHSGARVLQSAAKSYSSLPEYDAALAFKPHVVIILLGINDSTPSDWVNKAEFASDLKALVDDFKGVESDRPVKIWLGSIMPLFSWHRIFNEINPNVTEVRQQVEQVGAEEGLSLIDLTTLLVREPQYFPDSLHPIKEGAAIIAMTIHKAITGEYGGLSMPYVFGDHMVLQREKPISVWGRGNVGDSVSVRLAGETRTTIADANGRWRVNMPKMTAGGPYRLTVSADTTLIFSDVLIGEVWVAAGQSNMAWPLSRDKDADEEIPRSDYSNLRLLNRVGNPWPGNVQFSPEELHKITIEDYYEGRWQVSTPEIAASFSAVAYYFGRDIHEATGVPVGIIHNAIGGTTMESYMSREVLAQDPELRPLLKDWMDTDVGADWHKGRAATNLGLWADGTQNKPMPRHPFEPTFLYHSAIESLIPFAIRGVIWYQGESNATMTDGSAAVIQGLNQKLFKGLISDWRNRWRIGDFPFYYVQLPNLNRNWMPFREMQLETLKQLPNVGMVVTVDLGHPSDVHPPAKQELARRLSLWARAKQFGEADLVYSGPLFNGTLRVEGSALQVGFDHAGGGLVALGGGTITGFEIAGADGNWVPAIAAIKGNAVEVSSPSVAYPHSVRYAWAMNPIANLGNIEGLPASPFRAEHKKQDDP